MKRPARTISDGQGSAQMSAAILALSSAALAPVAQSRRRDPLPKTVRSLSAYRAERNKTTEERDAENIAQVKRQFFNVLDRVLRGEVTGIAIIESFAQGGTDQVSVSGVFEEDYAYLQHALGQVVAAVPRWASAKKARNKQAGEGET